MLGRQRCFLAEIRRRCGSAQDKVTGPPGRPERCPGAGRKSVDAAGQLTLHYMGNQPDRICVVTRGTEVPGHEDISGSPRMLAFIDVPPETMFLPQAAEL